ncbi:nuclear transport factor 2 family protein [Sphingomonas sp. MG17]|uniref:Nuclear transport factor 2 family protein n=1 Tax=Sphingomonas tagetis TaxID=2949092 RepID=A0A9X2KLB2_9SPHN|nr:nuclear transport factor 2 family protein [Sphingomonas tagetis]MCP3731364.1 nuclear transport factor 2 family protein [Sphingomonas tagetis]
MGAFAPAPSELEKELLDLERRRCDAICANDLETIDAMMSDTLTYVHKSGSVENKVTYRQGLTDLREFKSVEREELAIRVFGDVAIMTGIQRVLVRTRGQEAFREITVFATQVWAKSGGTWQMDVYHSTGV